MFYRDKRLLKLIEKMIGDVQSNIRLRNELKVTIKTAVVISNNQLFLAIDCKK